MSKKNLLLVLTLLPFVLYGESLSDTLQFSRENWKVAIEGFSGEISNENEYLKSSIPDLIKKELISAEYHKLSGNEIIYYQQRIVDEKKKSLIIELNDNYIKKDDYLFNMDNNSVPDELDNKISELNSALKEINNLDPSSLGVAELLPVEWINSNEEEDLLIPDQYRNSVVSELYDLDFLISGNIKEIDDYYLLEVQGYNQSSGERFVVYSNVGSTDDIEFMAREAANELRSVFLGRAWAVLIVESDHPEALIYSDGILIGIGRAEIKTIEPKEVFIEAIGEDTSYWSEIVELKALEVNKISASLSQSEIDFVTLRTEPPEADVYIGARWAGKTPLSLPRYKDRNLWISVKHEGFHDKSFEITSDSSEDLYFQLEEMEMTRLETFELRKKQFYNSLGWFSLSVAGPVVMGGIYSNFASRQNAYVNDYKDPTDIHYLDPDYADLSDEMGTNYNISYGVFWGTFAVSSGLLVDVFVKLFRYIKAAEAMAE